MKVRDLMTTGVASIDGDDSLSSAARMMWECDCGVIPVTRGGRVLGVITDRDICMASWIRNQPLSELCVSDSMSRELFSCSPDDNVSVAERLMQSRQIRRLPVIDKAGHLVGILSLADIVRGSERAGRGVSDVSSNEVASTLATICQPRTTQQAFA
jgi:CBS domain-containing protein